MCSPRTTVFLDQAGLYNLSSGRLSLSHLGPLIQGSPAKLALPLPPTGELNPEVLVLQVAFFTTLFSRGELNRLLEYYVLTVDKTCFFINYPQPLCVATCLFVCVPEWERKMEAR